MHTGCINVMHNEVDCRTAGLNFILWCRNCRCNIPQPLNMQSMTRGDVLTRCDACSITVDDFNSTPGSNSYMFDCQEECVRWDINPYEREYWMVCAACRFTERQREVGEETAMLLWEAEQRHWLDNGGQELIDSEPHMCPCGLPWDKCAGDACLDG
jgi:hypothetical protein